jgi:hypothetical protein
MKTTCTFVFSDGTVQAFAVWIQDLAEPSSAACQTDRFLDGARNVSVERASWS